MNELLPSLPALLKEVFSGIHHFVPEIVLILTFVIVILADLFYPGRRSSLAFWLCLAGISASAGWTFFLSEKQNLLLFGNTLHLDSLSRLFKQIFYVVVVLFAVFARYSPQISRHKKGAGDLYILLPAILLGLNLMSMASSLLMIYISIEMISLASYLLVGYVSGDFKQTEAAMKYVLFGSACSAMMLYGMSLLYGFTGTLNISDPAFLSGMSQMPQAASAVAVVLVLIGIGFKLSFVPLHFWSPDIYEGAPMPVTAFLSTGPKVAGFAILIRFLSGFGPTTESLHPDTVFNVTAVLSVIAILSMVIGNFVAVWQDNVKRMLAYSAIGHTGFILIAVIVNSHNGLRAMVFYLLIYALMNMAAFLLAGIIEDRSGSVSIKHYKGLGRSLRLEMICFVVVLVSLTGLPPLAGFMAKFLVFSAALESYSSNQSPWILSLLVTGAVTTVVSLFYYFKIPLNAFLRQGETEKTLTGKTTIQTFVVVVLSLLLLILGIFPGLLI